MAKRIALVVLALIVIALSVVVIAAVYDSEELIETKKMFTNLPDQPNDFLIIKRAIETGETTNICNVKNEYYKHPEFYPTWEQGKTAFYDNHDYSRWGVHGYGAYPADLGATISNFKKGESIDFCTIVKTSYGIETYQGVKMIFDNSEYFDIEIINQEFPEYKDHFIMYPTFPIFHENWTRQMHIRITAKQDVPIGEYEFGFNFATPNRDFNEEMVWEILMQDTDENIEYVKECVEEIHNSKDNSDIDTQCEMFMMQRQKKYVKGGTWSIGRDMYAITLDIV
jgi:hypothetical protein